MKTVIVEIEGGQVVGVKSNFKGTIVVKDRDGLQVGEGISTTRYALSGKQPKTCENELKKWKA